MTLLVVRLRGRAELVADDAVCLALLDESKRYEALFFEEPSLQILAVGLQTTILIALTRSPLVKQNIPIPQVVEGSIPELRQATTQGIIGKACPVSMTMRSKYSLECTVLIPAILPTILLRTEDACIISELLYEVSILVILEGPFSRLLDTTSLEVLA